MNSCPFPSLLLILFFTAGTLCFADEESVRSQIQKWVQQLGDESYLVRQRAESLLNRTGIQAYPELQRAKQSADIEVARRAEYILSQIEQAFRDTENREAAFWIHHYMMVSNPAEKAQTIWALASPFLDLTKGEGLPTLCRLVRFEENDALRVETAKTLIASPPTSPMARQRWYQSIRDNLQSTGNDEWLQCVADYAQLWCDLNDANVRTTSALQERVRQVGMATFRLLETSEHRIQIGSTTDILLYYAVAELQDAAGLTEEREKTVAAALAIEPKPIQTITPLEQIDVLFGDLLMNEHFYAGLYLKQCYRIHWAMAHFQKVMDTGDIALRIKASEFAAESAIYLAEFATAATLFSKHIEMLRGTDHLRNDAESLISQAERRRAYCLAEKAAEEENWARVRDIIVQVWAAEPPGHRDLWGDGGDIDLVIMAHRLGKQIPNFESEFKDVMASQLKKTWNSIIADIDDPFPDMRQKKMVNAFNTAAWLLANMDGDYHSALTLIEATLKIEPEEIGIQDTLAHVYFLGGNVDDAIRVQEQVVRAAPDVVSFQRALERFKNGKTNGSGTESRMP